MAWLPANRLTDFDASESLKIGEKIVNFSDIKFTFVNNNVQYLCAVIFSDYFRVQRSHIIFCDEMSFETLIAAIMYAGEGLTYRCLQEHTLQTIHHPVGGRGGVGATL